MAKYARMKEGQRPIALGGCRLVPAYPEYWEVPAEYAAAIDLLVRDGQIEYRGEFQRPPVTPNASRKQRGS